MSFELPEPIIDTLLDRLGNDDAFRDAFLADARTALASIGFEPAADPTVKAGLWECLTVSELASKEAIRSGHLVLRRQLTRSFIYFPFHVGFRSQVEEAAA